MIEDALSLCQTASTVGKCVLREVKSRGRSTMGAKAFVHILLSTSVALCDYAYLIATEQGIIDITLAKCDLQFLPNIIGGQES